MEQKISSIQRFHKTSNRQLGVALIFSMLMLLIMTVIGVTAMLLTTLEEKISGNQRDRNIAFQAAESALREGELRLADLMNPAIEHHSLPHFNCANSVCPLADVTNIDIWGDGGGSVNYQGDLSNADHTSIAGQPRYLIELLNNGNSVWLKSADVLKPDAQVRNDKKYCYYRITARGVGGTSTAVAIVQSKYISPPVKTPTSPNGACYE